MREHTGALAVSANLAPARLGVELIGRTGSVEQSTRQAECSKVRSSVRKQLARSALRDERQQ